jgi:tetratricopeptide (TPR) repeat protein
VAVLVLAVLLRRRRPWLSFGILWAAVGFLPVSQVVRIGAVMADRFLYLPAAGAAAALAAGLLALPRHRLLLLAGILAAFGALTVSREAVWRSDLTMNRDVLATYPGNADAYNRIGVYYDARNEHDREEAAYEKGLALAPGDRYLGKNYGMLLLDEGRLDRARAVLERALAGDRHYDRHTAETAWLLGKVLVRQGHLERARDVLRLAERRCPPLGVLSDLLRRVEARLGR